MKFLAFFLVVAVAAIDYKEPFIDDLIEAELFNKGNYVKPRSYRFGYIIRNAETATNYQREEISDGTVVSGSYRVHLPDGRLQIFNYRASPETGNVADVRYEGEAHYPDEIKASHAVDQTPAGSVDLPKTEDSINRKKKTVGKFKLSIEQLPVPLVFRRRVKLQDLESIISE